MLRIILRYPFHGDIKRIEFVVVRSVLESDRYVALGFPEVAVANVVDRQFLVIPSLSLRIDNNQESEYSTGVLLNMDQRNDGSA